MAALMRHFARKGQSYFTTYLKAKQPCYKVYYQPRIALKECRLMPCILTVHDGHKTNENYKRKTDFRPWILCVTAIGLKISDDDDKKTSESNDKGEVIHVIKRAKLAEHKQDFDEADMFYHRALAILAMYEQNKTWTEQRLIQARVYVYDSLANLALSLHDFQKAEGLFKETMRGLLQQGFEKTDNAVIEISLKLAMIYAMLKRIDEADLGYEYCIQALEQSVKNSHEDDVDQDTMALLGLCIDSYSRFLLVQTKYSEALASMQKALEIALKVFGEAHPQVAVINNDIATVLSLMEEYDSAKEYCTKAIVIAQKINSPDLPSFLCNLGAIYLYKVDLMLAERSCKKALKLSEQYNNEIAKVQSEKCLNEIKKKIQGQSKK